MRTFANCIEQIITAARFDDTSHTYMDVWGALAPAPASIREHNGRLYVSVSSGMFTVVAFLPLRVRAEVGA